MDKLRNELTEALDKLDGAAVKNIKGSKERAMAPAVAEALRNFCRQDAEFAQAVQQGGSFANCMTAVAKGVGQSISDVDAYKKAVAFYFPGATIRVAMTIDLIGQTVEATAPAEAPALRVVPKKDSLVLNLDDFF